MSSAPPSKPSKALLGAVLTAGVSAISASAIFIRLADAPGLSTATARSLLSAVLMAIIARATLGKTWWKLTRREWKISILAGVFLGMHFWAWMTSLEYTSVASSVLFVTMNPIFVGIASPFVTGKKISLRLWGAILLATSGALMVALDDLAQGPTDSLFGNGLALLGAMCASGYLMAGQLARKTVRLESYAVVTNGASAAFLLPFLVLGGSPFFSLSLETWGIFLVIALVPQLIGHNSLVWALKHISAPMVALVILAEPLGSGLLAWIFFGEEPSWTKALGAGVLLTGIFLASLKKSTGNQRDMSAS